MPCVFSCFTICLIVTFLGLLYNHPMANYIVKTKTKENITTNILTGAQKLIHTLESVGVEYIFGYPGASVLPVYNELSHSKINHILCRHEQGAIHSAEGYARIKGKAGVVLVTSGPGFSNTMTGILNAYSDKTPLVVITGQAENLHNNEFQSADIINIAKSCTKKCYAVNNAAEIEMILNKAFLNSQKTPCGPVVVTVTKSVLESGINENISYKIRKEIKVEASHSCVLRAIETLKSAKRPLIIAGGGCRYIENELTEFAYLTHIPVVNTLMGKDSCSNISLGLIGQSGDKALNDYIEKSDVVLALGVRFSNKTTNNKKFLPNSKIISINAEKIVSDNVKLEKEFTGELEVILQQIIGVIKAKNILFDIKYDWLESIPQKYDLIKNDNKQDYIISLISEYSKKYNPIVSTDVGEHQISAVKNFRTKTSKKFLTSGGFGTMGYGLPSAIGAHFAQPNSLILNLTGDGSFQMNMQELGTVSEYNIPLKIFILNNSSLGMIETTQRKNYNNTYQSSLINPDFKKIAESYGIQGYTIRTTEELESALKEIFKYKKAVLLDIKI